MRAHICIDFSQRPKLRTLCLDSCARTCTHKDRKSAHASIEAACSLSLARSFALARARARSLSLSFLLSFCPPFFLHLSFSLSLPPSPLCLFNADRGMSTGKLTSFVQPRSQKPATNPERERARASQKERASERVCSKPKPKPKPAD